MSLAGPDPQDGLQVRTGADGLEVDCERIETLEDDARDPPRDAIEPLEVLWEILVDGCAGVVLERILDERAPAP